MSTWVTHFQKRAGTQYFLSRKRMSEMNLLDFNNFKVNLAMPRSAYLHDLAKVIFLIALFS